MNEIKGSPIQTIEEDKQVWHFHGLKPKQGQALSMAKILMMMPASGKSQIIEKA